MADWFLLQPRLHAPVSLTDHTDGMRWPSAASSAAILRRAAAPGAGPMQPLRLSLPRPIGPGWTTNSCQTISIVSVFFGASRTVR